MKADILDLQANKVASLELPEQFNEEIRPDLIRRAFISVQSSFRQSYGAFRGAGMRQYANLSRRRRDFKATYGRGISRAPRKIVSRRGSQMVWIGAFAPGTVGGRRAHPPKSSKIYFKDINKKENRKAIRSAIAASINIDLIKSRGHKFTNAPLIIEEKLETISKSKDLVNILTKIGLKSEMERLQEKKIRPGRGKTRGRKYLKKTGPLIVASKKCALFNAAKNLQGFEIAAVHNLNAYLLAPGGSPGRLVIWSNTAIERLKSENLFMLNKKPKENQQKKEKKEPENKKSGPVKKES